MVSLMGSVLGDTWATSCGFFVGLGDTLLTSCCHCS